MAIAFSRASCVVRREHLALNDIFSETNDLGL